MPDMVHIDQDKFMENIIRYQDGNNAADKYHQEVEERKRQKQIREIKDDLDKYNKKLNTYWLRCLSSHYQNKIFKLEEELLGLI